MTAEMTPYDADAWRAVERWRYRRIGRPARQILPDSWRERLSDAGTAARERFQTLPGASQFEQAFVNALEGLTGLGSRVAMASVRHAAVVDAYRKRGHPVAELADVRRLDLRDVDAVKPRLDIGYIAAATLEGAGAGFAVSGGQLLAAGGTVVGAGAGAAPGAATVIGAMAADAAAVLLASHRAIAHVAAYYGYDVDDPQERLFAFGVLGVGTAGQAGKAAAYVELNKVVQALARNKTWVELNQHVVTRIVQRVYTVLGIRLTQRKLGQAIPVIGIVLGAGMNAQLLARVADDADHLYRERFLRERYGLPVDAGWNPSAAAELVPLAEIIDAEIIEDTSAAEAQRRGSVE